MHKIGMNACPKLSRSAVLTLACIAVALSVATSCSQHRAMTITLARNCGYSNGTAPDLFILAYNSQGTLLERAATPVQNTDGTITYTFPFIPERPWIFSQYADGGVSETISHQFIGKGPFNAGEIPSSVFSC